jgi:hypothetical protein
MARLIIAARLVLNGEKSKAPLTEEMSLGVTPCVYGERRLSIELERHRKVVTNEGLEATEMMRGKG